MFADSSDGLYFIRRFEKRAGRQLCRLSGAEELAGAGKGTVIELDIQ